MKLKLSSKKLKQLNNEKFIPLNKTKDIAGGSGSEGCNHPSEYRTSCQVH